MPSQENISAPRKAMKEKRIDSLEQYILENRSVTIDNICEIYNISKNTVRRDLEELVERGTIVKVYGGAKAVDTVQPKTPLSSFEERHIAHMREKDYICRLAANMVSDGDIIYIDTGTTCIYMVEYLKNIKCTIITNSLQVASSAVPYPNLSVIMLPGKLKRETLSFVGIEAIENLKIYNIDKAFMASTGVTIENGLTNASSEEYSIKKSVVENSAYLYLLADYTKFGRTALHTYCSLSTVNAIVTDQSLPDKYCTFCSTHNINIVY